jgi:hypothetical protein
LKLEDQLFVKIRVAKMDAALRQLDTAIRLWFSDGDAVSIHTLVGAAYQIIHDFNKQKGGRDLLFDSGIIKEEFRAQAIKFLRKDFNFFKHADEDPNDVTEFVAMSSFMFMLISIQTLKELGVRITDVQHTFTCYLGITDFPYIDDGYRAKLAAANPAKVRASVVQMSKQEFFKMSLQGLAVLRAEGKHI